MHVHHYKRSSFPVKTAIVTRKLSSDEGFQVFEDELPHTHFQFVWGKISYKGYKFTITHNDHIHKSTLGGKKNQKKTKGTKATMKENKIRE